MRLKMNLAAVFAAALLLLAPQAQAERQPDMDKEKEFRITRGMSKQARACIQCHKEETPALFVDWANSGHASSNISCLDCHQAEEHDKDVAKKHFEQYKRSDNKWG